MTKTEALQALREAEVAMDELDNYAPPANPAEDDANLFTGEGDE